MGHVMIVEAVRNWPPHWQKVFEELSIVMGKTAAYENIKMMRGENPYA